MADGPAGFTQDFSCPALLRSLLRFVWLRVLVYHHLWSDFPNASTHHPSCDIAVLQPQRCRNIGGLGSSPFARHYLGNHFLFSLPTCTKMFQFPAFAHHIVVRLSFRQPGCPIRKFTNQRLFAPPRDLSQLITSFIACKSLGIHRTPFLTCLPLLYCY